MIVKLITRGLDKVCWKYFNGVMVENILEKLPEIKKIYLEHYPEGAKAIFKNYLGNYFDTEKIPSKDWIFFIQRTKAWQEEAGDAEEISDEVIGEMQEKNRKRTIVLLKRLLDKYEKNKNFFKNITVREISLLYKIIQSAEEAMKRTELAKSKLKLDVVKTFFLPYAKYSPEDLETLKKQFDVAFQRVLKIAKTGKSGNDGQDSPGSGQV